MVNFDKITYRKEAWEKRKCALCGNKAELGCEILLNMHCHKCYKSFYEKVRDKNNKKRYDELYLEILTKKEMENGIKRKCSKN